MLPLCFGREPTAGPVRKGPRICPLYLHHRMLRQVFRTRAIGCIPACPVDPAPPFGASEAARRANVIGHVFRKYKRPPKSFGFGDIPGLFDELAELCVRDRCRRHPKRFYGYGAEWSFAVTHDDRKLGSDQGLAPRYFHRFRRRYTVEAGGLPQSAWSVAIPRR